MLQSNFSNYVYDKTYELPININDLNVRIYHRVLRIQPVNAYLRFWKDIGYSLDFNVFSMCVRAWN